MPHAVGDSFILEVPLETTAAEARTLAVRLDAGRQLYNACLGEALRRLRLLRESRGFRQARRLPGGPARCAAFRALDERFGFREYDLHAYAVRIRRSWLGGHLDVHVVQKLATRAFQAASEYRFGKRGRPRFLRRRELASVEGKSNAAGVRYREGRIEWRGLSLACRIDPSDPVVAHGLGQTVKYCRILRRTIRGWDRWYVQLVLLGRPYVKPKNRPEQGVVGLDIGPSTIAIVGEAAARLETFCGELVIKDREIRRVGRTLDRSRRATNPENFNPDGTVKPGARKWFRSWRYHRARARKAEIERRLAAQRKSLHGRLANEVVRLGAAVRTEAVSYHAFQRSFGRSVGRRAPALFVEALARKLAPAGGKMEAFDPRPTRLSQTCICGRIRKKSLSERVHRCACGVTAQRDLLSAFLARHVEEGRLDAGRAAAAWPGAEPLLRAASSRYQAARGAAIGRPRPGRGGSGSPAPERMAVAKAWDAVACAPAQGETPGEAAWSLEPFQ